MINWARTILASSFSFLGRNRKTNLRKDINLIILQLAQLIKYVYCSHLEHTESSFHVGLCKFDFLHERIYTYFWLYWLGWLMGRTKCQAFKETSFKKSFFKIAFPFINIVYELHVFFDFYLKIFIYWFDETKFRHSYKSVVRTLKMH